MRLPVGDAPVWLDGEEVPAAALGPLGSDPGFHAGLGVFETLASRAGRVLDVAEHVARLEDGCTRLGVPVPASDALRRTLGRAAARHADVPMAWIKVVATRGGHVLVFSGPFDPGEEGRPVSAVVLRWRRDPRHPLAGVKSLGYAANELGLDEARARGADEGLWRNVHGRLAEGCISNLFVVRRRRIVTPALGEGCLAGVVRGAALVASRRLGLDAQEGRVRVPRLLAADEAFLTSSLRGVRPLVRVDGRPVGSGAPGPVTRAIAEEVAKLRRA